MLPTPDQTGKLPANNVETARRYYDAAQAENTQRSYGAGWRAFVNWRENDALPVEAAEVASFVTELAQRQYKVSTIKARLAAIAAVHREVGADDPTKHEAVRRVVKGIAREHGTRPDQARGLTERDVAKIESVAPVRDLAMLLVARDLLARASELVALDIGDVDFDESTITIRRSKTDQEAEGTAAYIGPDARDALSRMLAAESRTEGPLFVSRYSRRLHPNDVSRAFKRIASKAGIEADKVSGHSARVGMAQDLAADGASLVELQNAGRWQSATMPARYSEKQAARRGAVARFHERRQ
jgi:site-specific recombinase XerD